jgi:uncharacterized protein YcbK (DUF882 family)
MEVRLSKNFVLSEFASKDGAPFPRHVIEELHILAYNLQALRDYTKRPVIILSGYRSFAHNKAVGGAMHSQHKKGRAADIRIPGMTPKEVAETIEKLIKEKMMVQGGLCAYDTFTHYDTRGYKARW